MKILNIFIKKKCIKNCYKWWRETVSCGNLSLKETVCDGKICNVFMNIMNMSWIGPHNIEIVEGSKVLETIVQISVLFENNKISQTDRKNFFEKNINPIYGKVPSTN